MSGSTMGDRAAQPERELTPVEQHLGDRLAALIDGELDHDARERVLSHLATCCGCKAEADAQRRVKNVFADTAPPPPSDGLLARLQGLPGGTPYGGLPGGGEGFGLPGGGSGPAADPLRNPPVHPTRSAEPGSVWALDQLWGGRGLSALAPNRGFRIHEPERGLSSRGRRFAFAAAGAVSLAALALASGVGTGGSGGATVAKGDSGSTSASSVRTASSGGGGGERRRRDGGGTEHESSGPLINVSTQADGSSGAPLSTAPGVHRGAFWAAPTAAPADGERTGSGHPLLRDAFLSTRAARSLPPTADTEPAPYTLGAEAYAGLPPGAFPGGTIRQESGPASAQAGRAAYPRR